MELRKFIKTTLRKYLNENTINDNNLILFHGSNSRKIYDYLFDNQFYTVNDYIASNYAYNFGGLMYEVKVSNLKPFELKSYHKIRDSEKYDEMVALLKTLYDDNVADNYENKYFTPSPSYTFGEYGWEPMIEWCKKMGYNSIKFYDESFDTFVQDITYLIFDGNKPKIINVYEVEDAVESNFSKDFKKIK
jgi:hypothetical protein